MRGRRCEWGEMRGGREVEVTCRSECAARSCFQEHLRSSEGEE
jgi:hypothetical protein